MINHHGTVIFLDGVGDEWGYDSGLCGRCSQRGAGCAPPPTVMADAGSLAAERWSVLIRDRLSASQPISLRSPLTGRQLGSCEQPAHSLSLVCFENLLAWESVGLGEEAKHRQVLTSGEKSRCRLMTMMMVRMMHLFPCLYELHRVVWRGVGASFFFFISCLTVMVDFSVALRLRVSTGELNTARHWERISASARSAAPWPWTSRLARCLRWSRFWCLWTCCWCSSSVLVNGSALGARFAAHRTFTQERRERQCALVESGDTRRSITATRWNEWRWYNIMYFCYPPPQSFVMSCVLSPFVIASVVWWWS